MNSPDDQRSTATTRSTSVRAREPRHFDTAAFVVGLLSIGLASCFLLRAVTGSFDWQLIKVAGPLLLIIGGVVGLLLSRARAD